MPPFPLPVPTHLPTPCPYSPPLHTGHCGCGQTCPFPGEPSDFQFSLVCSNSFNNKALGSFSFDLAAASSSDLLMLILISLSCLLAFSMEGSQSRYSTHSYEKGGHSPVQLASKQQLFWIVLENINPAQCTSPDPRCNTQK